MTRQVLVFFKHAFIPLEVANKFPEAVRFLAGNLGVLFAEIFGLTTSR